MRKTNAIRSLAGTYLAACMVYTTLVGQAPEGNTYTAGLSEDVAKYPQTVAWQTVQGYSGK